MSTLGIATFDDRLEARVNEALGENDVDRRVRRGRYVELFTLDMTYLDAKVPALRNEGTLLRKRNVGTETLASVHLR